MAKSKVKHIQALRCIIGDLFIKFYSVLLFQHTYFSSWRFFTVHFFLFLRQIVFFSFFSLSISMRFVSCAKQIFTLQKWSYFLPKVECFLFILNFSSYFLSLSISFYLYNSFHMVNQTKKSNEIGRRENPSLCRKTCNFSTYIIKTRRVSSAYNTILSMKWWKNWTKI